MRVGTFQTTENINDVRREITFKVTMVNFMIINVQNIQHIL